MTYQRFFSVSLGFLLIFAWASSVWAFHTWHRAQLPNGLTFLVVEKPNAPVVSLTLLITRGTSNASLESKEIATLIAQQLTQGTRHRSVPQIAEHIARLGGRLSMEVDFDWTRINWTVLKEDLSPALDVLADMVVQPSFPQDAFEREREAAIAEYHARRTETPAAQLLRHFFGTGPYGVPAGGGTVVLEQLERQDIVQFHRQTYHPGATILAAAGAITLEELEALANKYFGDWAGSAQETTPPAALTVNRAPTTLIVNRPLVHAWVRLAFVGAAAASPDTPPLRLLSQILAGDSDSRLWQNLRQDKQWTYDIWSEADTFVHAGLFFIALNVPYEVILPALKETVREIVRLQTETVSEAELEQAKRDLTARFYFETENVQDLSRVVAQQEAHTQGQTAPDAIVAALRRVTADDIQRVARTYLDLQGAVVTVEGNTEAVEKYAPVLVQGKLPWGSPQPEGKDQPGEEILSSPPILEKNRQ